MSSEYNIPDLKGKKILIVEDEENNYYFIEELVKKTRSDYWWAKDGYEAIEMVENNAIDLVLLDIKLPGMDGYEVAKKIKRIKPEVVIMAQTAYAMSHEKADILKAGCDDYIPKPIDIGVFFYKIKNLFND